jgi:hypothetical protein
MRDLPYSAVISRLLESLPEIQPYYDGRVKEAFYAEGIPDVIYGSILVEYLNQLAEALEMSQDSSSRAAEQSLKRAFDLLEELAASSDFETRCIVEVSVMEGLLPSRSDFRRFRPYMGPKTLEMALADLANLGIDPRTES